MVRRSKLRWRRAVSPGGRRFDRNFRWMGVEAMPNTIVCGGGVARSLYVFHRRAAEEAITGEPCRIGSKTVPAWDGGVDRNGRRHKAAWPKVAALIAKVDADPAVYVEAAFASRVSGPPPQPNMLLGEAAVERFNRYVDESPRRARDLLRIESDAFVAAVYSAERRYGLDVEEAAVTALRDPVNGLSPLFRVATATRGGASEAVVVFRQAALLQLAVRRHALTVGWGDLVPLDLSREVDAHMEVLFQGGGRGYGGFAEARGSARRGFAVGGE